MTKIDKSPKIDIKAKHLGGGVVLFEDAISVPTQEIIELIDSLSDKSIKDQYTYMKDDDGKPSHALNKSGFIISLDEISKMPIRVQELCHPFFSECEDIAYKCLMQYIEMFPAILQCLWWKTEGHALKYPTGASLGFHCDNDVNYKYGQLPKLENATRNVVSVIVYLNSNCDSSDCDELSFSGGEMVIPYFGITIKPKSGTIVFVPANYLGAHEILEVKSGSRYSYLMWFAQGSPNPESGVSPREPREKIGKDIGGQWWLPTLIDDYENYLLDKYNELSNIPFDVNFFKLRPDDHK